MGRFTDRLMGRFSPGTSAEWKKKAKQKKKPESSGISERHQQVIDDTIAVSEGSSRTYGPAEKRWMEAMAEDAAARHRIPKSTVEHPKNVIVPGDPFMTEKLKDPDYVPYCGPCMPMQRIRRVADGFVCPGCGNKSNFDLTKFNGNVDVKYSEPA